MVTMTFMEQLHRHQLLSHSKENSITKMNSYAATLKLDISNILGRTYTLQKELSLIGLA
jgi:hypothetical protein